MNFETRSCLHKLEQYVSDENLSENQEFKGFEPVLEEKLKLFEPKVQKRLKSELFGFGPLDPLLEDSEITEIIVNSHCHIYYEKNGEFHSIEDHFASPSYYEKFCFRLCQLAGIHFDLNQPFGDGSWNGFRIHLIAPPLTKKEISLCFRKHPETPWNLNRLLENKWCDDHQFKVLKSLVRHRKNILIVGPTGCGKTSLINSLLNEVESNDRVVILDDGDELRTPNSLSICISPRPSNNSDLKNIELNHLLREALRMRPQRLVLGEIRGNEAKDFMMALSTGHRGSWGSIHAKDAKEALWRLEMMVQWAAPQWEIHAVRSLIALSLDAIITLEMAKGHRELKSIHLVRTLESSGLTLEKVDPELNVNV